MMKKIVFFMLIFMVFSISNAFISTKAEILAPPVIHDLVVEPENPTINDDLECVWDIKEYNDEEFSVKISWYVDGKLTNYSSDIINSGLTKKNEVWMCYIEATDESGLTSDKTASVEIQEIEQRPTEITGKVIEEVEKPRLPMFLEGLLDIFSKIFGW